MPHGCHPNATARILARMKQRGFDELTVMASLQFGTIAHELHDLGVQLTIIAPQPGWELRYPPEMWTPEMHAAVNEYRRKK